MPLIYDENLRLSATLIFEFHSESKILLES